MQLKETNVRSSSAMASGVLKEVIVKTPWQLYPKRMANLPYVGIYSLYLWKLRELSLRSFRICGVMNIKTS